MTKLYLEESLEVAKAHKGQKRGIIEEHVYRYLLEEYDLNSRFALDLAREASLSVANEQRKQS